MRDNVGLGINGVNRLTLIREVLLLQFVLFDFEGVLEKLFSLLASHSDVHSNLFVSLDREASNGVSCL